MDWLLLTLFILALTYAAFVIKEEKAAYQDSADDTEFFQFMLFTPSWWRKISDTPENEIIFQREDTSYEWKASIKWVADNSETTALEIAEMILKERNIVFDEAQKSMNDNEVFFSNSKVRERIDSFVRIEGTATEDIEHRCYLDILIFKDIIQPGFLICISRSSVLNGMVEGPYFEEVIKGLDFTEPYLA